MYINVIKMSKCERKGICLRINETPASSHPVIGQMPRALVNSVKKEKRRRNEKEKLLV